MGRPLRTNPVGFSLIGHDHGSTVYAVELSNGVVKVGYSHTPRNRVLGLARECRRRFRAEILRVYVGQPLPYIVAVKAERTLIERMGRIATALPGCNEYFRDTHFGIARNLVNQVCAAFLLVHSADGARI